MSLAYGIEDLRSVKSQRLFRLIMFVLFLGAPAMTIGMALGADDSYTVAPINYLTAQPEDAIAELQRKMDRGEVHLQYDAKHGWLLSVLQQLHVPISSQMLVFSKTSLQRERISPRTPRALYFNDRVYVGWIPDADYVEISSVDPQLGAVFYVLPQYQTATPKFERKTFDCVACHDTSLAHNVPGHIMRSVYTNRDGTPILAFGSFLTSDQSPHKERWGGWYVTGQHGAQRHMGNMVADNEASPQKTDWGAGANITDLSHFFDTKQYLSRHSDIVALLVAEHQTQIQNLITRANFETRRALDYNQMMNKALGRKPDYRSESAERRIQNACDQLLQGMFFVGETKLTAPVSGTSGFTDYFAKIGPHDRNNRSLRTFDLHRRLFRYPLSYEIYSDAFQGLPDTAKECLYQGIEKILTGQDHDTAYSELSLADRQTILEILRDTKPEFVAWESRHH